MQTLKEADDGKLYHARYDWDDATEKYKKESVFIKDEYGELIPENICLCYAHEPHECLCGCSNWGDYTYDD